MSGRQTKAQAGRHKRQTQQEIRHKQTDRRRLSDRQADKNKQADTCKKTQTLTDGHRSTDKRRQRLADRQTHKTLADIFMTTLANAGRQTGGQAQVGTHSQAGTNGQKQSELDNQIRHRRAKLQENSRRTQT